jgi:hypothetical protein
MSGAFTQREMRRSDLRDVCFAPESDRLLRSSEMTRWATFCRTHSQQKQRADHREIGHGLAG